MASLLIFFMLLYITTSLLALTPTLRFYKEIDRRYGDGASIKACLATITFEGFSGYDERGTMMKEGELRAMVERSIMMATGRRNCCMSDVA